MAITIVKQYLFDYGDSKFLEVINVSVWFYHTVFFTPCYKTMLAAFLAVSVCWCRRSARSLLLFVKYVTLETHANLCHCLYLLSSGVT